MKSESDLERLYPTGQSERIERIDVLRGFALFGVLVANMIVTSRFASSPEHAASLATAAWDPIVEGLYIFLVRGKFYNLFALLFGLGFALQLGRAEARGARHTPIFMRRMGWLFVIGAVHALFLWWGDILHLYALAGLTLPFFRRAAGRTLVVLGGFLALVTPLAHWTWYRLQPPAAAAAAAAGPDPRIARVEVLREGSYGEVLSESWERLAGYFEPTLLAVTFLSTLGFFLIGCWLGRGGWLEAQRVARTAFTKILVVGLLAGLPLNAVVAGFEAFRWGPPTSPAYILSMVVGTPALAAAYLALVCLLFERPVWHRWLMWFSPVGRMALTHYLVHSLFFFGIFYGVGPGLGLAGRIGQTLAALLAVAIFAFQVLVSRWWLSRFRFGPVEWLWRSLTYGERPPFRSTPARSS